MDSNSYIDGFLCAVPTARRDEYRQHASEAARIFRKHGALALVECWGDEVPEGKLTSMPMAVKCQPDETVVFAWAVWPSKAVRDAGMQAIDNDPDTHRQMQQMPFDGKRVIYGGFTLLVDG